MPQSWKAVRALDRGLKAQATSYGHKTKLLLTAPSGHPLLPVHTIWP